MQKIGIFGGTFDPFHKGHLTICKCFVEKYSLDKCFIVPAKCSPFKADKNKLHTDKERIKIIENEIINIPALELSKYEIDKNDKNISYSIDTIRHFKENYANADLFLLIGYDVALQFNKWKDYKEILKLTKIVIATRPEPHTTKEDKQIEIIFKNTEYLWLDNPIVNITGTKIRKKLLEK